MSLIPNHHRSIVAPAQSSLKDTGNETLIIALNIYMFR